MNNVNRTIVLAALLALATSVQAQTCSGGADGGMDATGNQCATSPTYVESATAGARRVDQRHVDAPARPLKTVAWAPKRAPGTAEAARRARAPASSAASINAVTQGAAAGGAQPR